MADALDNEQRELNQVWKKARKDGCFPQWEQVKIVGLKEAWEEVHGEKTYGQATWIAERVCVQGRPERHPSIAAIHKLPQKMPENDYWFPGKVYGPLGGRPTQSSETNKAAMATSTMGM